MTLVKFILSNNVSHCVGKEYIFVTSLKTNMEPIVALMEKHSYCYILQEHVFDSALTLAGSPHSATKYSSKHGTMDKHQRMDMTYKEADEGDDDDRQEDAQCGPY